MAEYIEREAAIEALCSDCCAKECDKGLCQDYQNISVLPAAEVREVVLCKDCMMRQYCKVAQYLGADGFCSNGEKREES